MDLAKITLKAKYAGSDSSHLLPALKKMSNMQNAHV